MRIQAVILIVIFMVVKVVCDSYHIIGDPNSRNNIPGAYMVEFLSSAQEDGRSSIVRHLVHSHGLSEHTISFRSATRTNLFHGHSFQLSGVINEKHLLEIPGAINVYRVNILLSYIFIACFVVRFVVYKRRSQ